MTNPDIELEDCSFAIGKKEILKNISLTIRESEYFSIIGPNGAGKTTLLKCLNKILVRSKGLIKIKGKLLDDYDQKDIAKLISYVPQTNGLLFPFKVYEFVMMGRYPYLSPFSSLNAWDHKMVRDALSLTGTECLAERIVDTLSGGERQKIFIAAALAQGAKILLLDEPTTFLDPKHKDDIHKILNQINRDSGITIVSVTHDINSAVLFSKRILALKNGSAVFCGPAEKIMNNRILKQIYEKDFLFVKHPQTGHPVIVQEAIETSGEK